jgi:hypothetical protein
MNHQDRYLISVSYNEAAKRDMFHVWDNNDSLIRSAHETQREANAAMKRYIADDKRKAEKKA